MSVITRPSTRMAQALVQVPPQRRLQPQRPAKKHFLSTAPTVFRPITVLGIIHQESRKVARLFIIAMAFAACRMLRRRRHHTHKQVVMQQAGTGTPLPITAPSLARREEPKRGSVRIFLNRGATASARVKARNNAIRARSSLMFLAMALT